MVNLEANLPYQDEPLSIEGQNHEFIIFAEEGDREGIPHDVLGARNEGKIIIALVCYI